jgi:hypothetical protein
LKARPTDCVAAPPKRSDSLRAYDLGGSLLVYLPAQGSVTALNAEARRIWEECDGTRDAQAIARRIADHDGEPPAPLVKQVEDTLQALAAAGLLESERGAPDDEKLVVAFDGYAVEIAADERPLLEPLRHRFAHMASAGAPIARVTLRRRAGAIDVFSDPQHVRHERTLEEAVRCAETEVLAAFAERRPDLLWLHAAAVAREGSALLVVAASGQGKSTLATQLLARGWSYLSDESVAIARAPLVAYPVPLSPRVRRAETAEVPPERVHALERVEVEVPAAAVCDRPTPIAAVVMPEFVAGSAPVLERLPRAEGALRILQNCQGFDRSPEVALSIAAALAIHCPHYRLRYSVGNTAAALVEELLGGSPPSS